MLVPAFIGERGCPRDLSYGISVDYATGTSTEARRAAGADSRRV